MGSNTRGQSLREWKTIPRLTWRQRILNLRESQSGHFMTPQMLLRDFVEPETSKRLLPIKCKTIFMWRLSRLSTWITEGSCVPAFFINKAIDPQSWPGAARCLLSFAVMILYILVESHKSWANTQSATRGLVWLFFCLLFGYFLSDFFTFDFCSLPPPPIFSSINVTAL